MTPQTRQSLDEAISDIQSQITKVNEITCDKFKTTTEFLMSCLPDLDEETKLHVGQMVGMYTILHFAKHNCLLISKTEDIKQTMQMALLLTLPQVF